MCRIKTIDLKCSKCSNLIQEVWDPRPELCDTARTTHKRCKVCIESIKEKVPCSYCERCSNTKVLPTKGIRGLLTGAMAKEASTSLIYRALVGEQVTDFRWRDYEKARQATIMALMTRGISWPIKADKATTLFEMHEMKGTWFKNT
jgi:hypothetical protein